MDRVPACRRGETGPPRLRLLTACTVDEARRYAGPLLPPIDRCHPLSAFWLRRSAICALTDNSASVAVIFCG
eukprot:COSAG02_NODE_46437_length_349_cov_0.496000_1_plen_71_part_10